MALCCRQSAVSPRAHGRTNARWQLVHGDPNPWRPKTIAQRCGAAIAVSASAGSAFLSPLYATQRVIPTGPWVEAMRKGNFEVALDTNGHGVVNPPLDVQKVLPTSVAAANYGQYQDQREIDLYQRMLRETDFAKQRTLMRDFEKYVLDTEAHEICLLWWYRMVPYRSYVKGWKISPSQLVNQDLATIWLNR